VIICADHDAPGLRFANAAATRWVKQGLNVKIAKPPKVGQDFNDLLKGA
jgi:hypothetical protein